MNKSAQIANLTLKIKIICITYESNLMKYDKDKVDEMVLALFHLTNMLYQYATRVWKDLETLEQLYQKGYISDPKAKSPTLVLTEEGDRLFKELFF